MGNNKKCKIDNCENPKIHGQGMCSKHYRRWKTYGDGPELYFSDQEMQSHGQKLFMESDYF